MRRGYYTQSADIGWHIMPYKQIDEFKNDSSDLDTGATLIKLEKDDKYEYATYYNAKGIVSKFKRKIKKNNE